MNPRPPEPIPYRLLEHTADIKVEIYGSDLAELFANAATCVFDLILDRETVRETVTRPVRLESESLSELFLDWLRELLFLFSTHSLAVRRVQIKSIAPASVSPPSSVLHPPSSLLNPLDPSIPSARYSIEAEVFGEEFDQERHGLKVEVKTPTYHQYRIDRTDTGYRATVIFDV